MALDGILRRRLLGLAALGIALLMLVLGQTVLLAHLRGAVFLVYWLGCLGFTAAAVVAALVDAHATGTELRKQNLELFEQTVKDIEADAAARGNGHERFDRRSRRPPLAG